ncbi:MAG TPA: CBS domain-containing protein [Bryobacteraceae bacterium]|nr:CBS domain-containing protein [Bryobacteraceae bacterium]
MPPHTQRSESALYLLAGDLMSSPAIAAQAKASVSSVARLMLESGVGGIPVVDAAGSAVGMVSDGDLMGRRSDAHRQWWLEMLARGAPPDGFPQAQLERPVGEVMSSPLITISAKAPVQDIAEALQAHRIKRLPVIDEGRLVGVVSRADLLCVVESVPVAAPAREGEGSGLLSFLESLIGGASLRGGPERPAPQPPQEEKQQGSRALSAAAFREAARAYKSESTDQREARNREAQLERRRQIKVLLDHHVSGELWRELLDHAELAARSGERELMMLRFPSDLCSDGGRKIDVAEDGWEGTLRGEAAELYSRWRTELKPQGFGLSARIVSYEDGIIGDIGLYLTWAD